MKPGPRFAAWASSLLLLLAAMAAAAQDATLVASVDRDTIRENETFTYILRAEGQISGRPDLSVLSHDFDILDTGSSTRIQIVNGHTTQVAEWTVELMPRQSGDFELPPVQVGGVMSNAVKLEIMPAPQGAQSSQDIFIEVELDREAGYVQAQAVYTLRLFVGIGTGRATLTEPTIQGGDAIVEKLGSDRDYQSVRGDRVYNVRERKYAIFPQAPGTITIGPAVFEAMITPTRGFARQQRLRSDVVELKVKPAVPPPPEYPDAVWLPASDLRIDESWSDRATSFEQGVPRTRVLTVVADGLLETQLPELSLPEAPGLRQYANQPELSRSVTTGGIEARRTERYAVIAQQPGTIDLPPIELPWWNVDEERWEVARVPVQSIDVTPSQQTGPVDEAAPAGRGRPIVIERGAGWWPWLSGALALGWAATLAAWLIGARLGRRPRPARREAKPPSGRSLLKQIGAACRVDDARRTSELLLAWAALQFPGDPPTSLGGLAERLTGPLAEEIDALEAALYGRKTGEWRGRRLADLIRHTQSVGRQDDSEEPDPLVPLYR